MMTKTMKNETEIWKSVKDFPDYEVSDLGRIKSYKVPPWKDPHISFGSVSNNGYYRVALSKQNEASFFLVHRLVLEAFIGPCPNGHETNHKKGIKTDNRLKELEWVIPSDNMAHAYLTGLYNRGITARNIKLRDEEILEIRRLAKEGIKNRTIAKIFKIGHGHVSAIVCRRLWSHI